MSSFEAEFFHDQSPTSTPSTMPATPARTPSTVASLSPSEDEVKRKSFYALCRPFLVIMRLGGMFFMQPQNYALNRITSASKSITTLDPPLKPHRYWLEIVSKIYCILGFFFVCIFGGKFFYSFHSGISKIKLSPDNLALVVGRVGYTIWIVQIILTHLIFLRSCWRHKGMTRVFASWERLQYECCWQKCPSFAELFCSRRNILCILATVHSVATLFVAIAPVFFLVDATAELRYELSQGFAKNSFFVAFTTCTGGFFAVLIFIVPGYFFWLNGAALAINFTHLSVDLKMNVLMDGQNGRGGMGLTPLPVEYFRVQHGRLCSLLSVVDDVFGPWIGVTLACSTVQIFCTIFAIYAVVNAQPVTFANAAYWLVSYFVQMALTLYPGVIVHSAVKIKDFYFIPCSSFTYIKILFNNQNK